MLLVVEWIGLDWIGLDWLLRFVIMYVALDVVYSYRYNIVWWILGDLGWGGRKKNEANTNKVAGHLLRTSLASSEGTSASMSCRDWPCTGLIFPRVP
jgi:hypothetical protein